MHYHQDDKGEYYYQDAFCMIYEYVFLTRKEALKVFVSWKATASSFVAPRSVVLLWKSMLTLMFVLTPLQKVYPTPTLLWSFLLKELR